MDNTDDESKDIVKDGRSIHKHQSGIHRLKSLFFEPEELSEEAMKNITPNDLVPNKASLMKKVLINSRQLFDIFKFTLIYKKKASSGLQFYGMRKYTPEDDASKIDWKASVRMSAGHEKIDELYLKVYEEEMDLATFILLDSSSTMLFGTKECLKSDMAAVVAATLGYAAAMSKTKIGTALFNKKIKELHAPMRGEVQFHRILDSICDPRNYWGNSNMGKAIEIAQESLNQRTLFVIISDFIDIKDDWYTPLKQCSEKFDSVIGVMVRDPMDYNIPQGLGSMRVSYPYRRTATEVDFDKIREEYNRQAKEEEEEIRHKFNNVGAGFVKLDTTTVDFIRPFLEYFEIWAFGR